MSAVPGRDGGPGPAGFDPGRESISDASIAHAIAQGEIVPWFQPIKDLESGRTIGVEALARWQHTDGPPITPDRFLAIAERSDLVRTLDWAVIDRAFLDVREWHGNHPDLRISINLSARHFADPDLVSVLQRTADRTGIAAADVDIEITETVPPTDLATAARITAQLRAAGFRIWLDDFGTGWNSLEHLLSLTVDGLKIDRSFAALLDTRPGRAVTSAVASLAAELDLAITMEGVETPEQADAARQLGCRYAQGYLWSRPVDALRVEPLL